MPEHRADPARHAEFRALLRRVRNWGRWGPDDQRGAVNLIDSASVRRAVDLVRLGITVSMARDLPTEPTANNPHPVDLVVRRVAAPDGLFGAAGDHLALRCHGSAITHIDALCHMWTTDGMWNGRDPDEQIDTTGARWGGLEAWADGIVTRGVVLDVAAHRPQGFVEEGVPVTRSELANLARSAGAAIEPGDALIVHCGREAWEAAKGRPWSSRDAHGADERPGLDASCLEFFADIDCSMIIWDMMDVRPNRFGVTYSTHAALFTQGIALVDNAALGPLAARCREHARQDFLTIVAPLRLPGATGCAVNPLAIL